ncbi:MAG: phosphate acetyltransferase [Clostridiales bacterium]|jgi:phosphate acetyltransferase|nr:phosphate acetyltransferase [Clostridiales bacterium]
MNNVVSQLRDKASRLNKHIILAEGDEPRTIKAARFLVDNKIANVTLIASLQSIKKSQPNVSLEHINIIDPNEDNTDMVNLLYNLRKSKGMTEQQANELAKNPLYLAALFTQSGKADGMVAGAINSTGDVLRPALQIIKTAQGISTVSSCFIIALPDYSPYFSKNSLLFMGDCAVNIEPDSQQLASIAIASANTAKQMLGVEPKIAMLSFSTKGSAQHQFVDKVVQATDIVKNLRPDLQVDGELQADAALIESVAQLKAKNSKIAGFANVLIFPDLQSGNIGYKLVQRLAGAQAIGPVCQGFNKPVNDLSRGCSVEDIITVVAITALQAQN